MNAHIPLNHLNLLGAPPAQYRMRLTVGEHSARHVRRIVRSYLRAWDLLELSDAVELGATELVANVVRHVPDRRCEVLLLRQTAGIRVQLKDGFPQLPSVPSNVTQEAESGRGLTLLEAVTDRWGVEPGPDGGKTVWFECRHIEDA